MRGIANTTLRALATRPRGMPRTPAPKLYRRYRRGSSAKCARRPAAPRSVRGAPKRLRCTALCCRRPGAAFPRPPASRAARMEVGSHNSAVLRAAAVLIGGGDNASSLGTLRPGGMRAIWRSWGRAARAAGALLGCYQHATHSCTALAETRSARAYDLRTCGRALGSRCAARGGGAPAHLLQGPTFRAPPRRRPSTPRRETSHARSLQYSPAAAQVSGRAAHAVVTFGNVGGPVSCGQPASYSAIRPPFALNKDIGPIRRMDAPGDALAARDSC